MINKRLYKVKKKPYELLLLILRHFYNVTDSYVRSGDVFYAYNNRIMIFPTIIDDDSLYINAIYVYNVKIHSSSLTGDQ